MKDSYIVFSDVDETLIRFKSMMTFMDYFLYETAFARAPSAADKRTEFEAIKAANTSSADRVALNRRFYEMFAGIAQAELQSAANTWLSQIMARGDLFVPSAFEEQRQHKARGAELVLVSGSFRDILAPISAHVGADHLLCSEIEVKDGVYTGRLLQQVIGDGKWEVIAKHLSGRSVDLKACYAYGDHVSDICFMEKFGNPIVVGAEPRMMEIAKKRQWRVIAAD
ncbi:MAG: HAD family hydrolase [Myxococcota bacterium]